MDNNYFNNGYGMGGAYRTPSVNNYNPVQTNIIRVTGLDEAIMRTTRPGSEVLYIHQDRDEFYIVKVDFDGRKSWATFNFSVPNPDATAPVTRADLTVLVNRLEELEKKVNGGVTDAEPVG